MDGRRLRTLTDFLPFCRSVVLVAVPRAVGRVERGDWSLDLALIDRLSGLTRRGWNYSSKPLLSNFEMGICSDGRSPLSAPPIHSYDQRRSARVGDRVHDFDGQERPYDPAPFINR